MVGGRQHLAQVQRLARNGRSCVISIGCKIYILAENSLYKIRPGGTLREKCGAKEL
jgi:hypothetical protein